MKSEEEWLMAQKAEAFGMLAAIESESWQFSHPQEFASLKSKFKHMLVADREGRLFACATALGIPLSRRRERRFGVGASVKSG